MANCAVVCVAIHFQFHWVFFFLFCEQIALAIQPFPFKIKVCYGILISFLYSSSFESGIFVKLVLYQRW